MLDLMDMSVDPCADFHRFGCGGWLSAKTGPASGIQRQWDIYSDHRAVMKRDKRLRSVLESAIDTYESDSVGRKLKLLYQKCMNVRAINELDGASLIEGIDKLGGWAVTGKSSQVRRSCRARSAPPPQPLPRVANKDDPHMLHWYAQRSFESPRGERIFCVE